MNEEQGELYGLLRDLTEAVGEIKTDVAVISSKLTNGGGIFMTKNACSKIQLRTAIKALLIVVTPIVGTVIYLLLRK